MVFNQPLAWNFLVERNQINSLSNDILVEILLYGDKDFSDDVNNTILEFTIKFINETGRHD